MGQQQPAERLLTIEDLSDIFSQTLSVLKQQLPVERLLTIEDLAKIFGKTPSTLTRDLSRRPWTLPPRLSLPETNIVRWSPSTVRRWIDDAEFRQECIDRMRPPVDIKRGRGRPRKYPQQAQAGV